MIQSCFAWFIPMDCHVCVCVSIAACSCEMYRIGSITNDKLILDTIYVWLIKANFTWIPFIYHHMWNKRYTTIVTELTSIAIKCRAALFAWLNYNCCLSICVSCMIELCLAIWVTVIRIISICTRQIRHANVCNKIYIDYFKWHISFVNYNKLCINNF